MEVYLWMEVTKLGSFFFCLNFRKGCEKKEIPGVFGRIEGERLVSCISAMGTRVSG